MGDGEVAGPGWGVEGTRPGAEKRPPMCGIDTIENRP